MRVQLNTHSLFCIGGETVRSYATVYLAGWLAQDPTERQAGEYRLTTVDLAVSAGKKNDPKAFDYFTIEAWREAGEYLAALKKGDFLVVRGRLRQERWENREGQKRSRIVVTADDLAIAQRERPRQAVPAASQQEAEEVPF